MTVFEVRMHDKGFCIDVTGHADYAADGQDIVCAGASMLVCAFNACGKQYNGFASNGVSDSGEYHCQYDGCDKSVYAYLNMLFVGAKLLANAYPDHVSIIYR